MNIVILTGRFGMGHVKAAEAIREQILMQSPQNHVEIIDFMDYMFPPVITKAIYKGFNFMVSSCSGLYNQLNKAAGKAGGVPLKVAVTRKIDKLIEEHQVDVIVVAFPVCSQYISAYKKMRRCNIPLYTYITDITAHEEWIADGTDKYFVGDITTKQALISKGVDEALISVTGIPVRKSFYNIKTGTARRGNKEILVMGGGLGLIPSSDEFLKVLSNRSDVHVTVITGKNEKLRNEIQRKYPKVKAIGYTNHVDEYMKRSDLIVTKAGGITTFEAIAARTPLYIIKPFLEQEFGNAKYIEDHNIGRVLWDEHADEVKDILKLIEDPGLLNKMKANMTAISESFEENRMYA